MHSTVSSATSNAPASHDAGAASRRRLLDPLRDPLRYLHYSLRTGEAYAPLGARLRRLVRHASSTADGAAEVQAFLTCLTVERRVSVSTHWQALAALLSAVGHRHAHRAEAARP